MIKEQKIWSLVLYLFLLVSILWVLIGAFSILLGLSNAYAFSPSWNEDFEGLTPGSINGQGDWHSTQGLDAEVSTGNPYSGAKGLKIYWEDLSYRVANPLFNPDTEIANGEVVFSVWVNPSSGGSSSANSIFLFRDDAYQPENGTIIFGFQIDKAAANLFFVGNTIGTDINPEKRIDILDWAKITLTANFDTRKYYIDVFTDEENWPQYEGIMSAGQNISMMSFECFNCIIWVDDMEFEIPSARVWGITPASETEITDLNTTFEFGWEGLDDWDTLSVVFKNRQTGIFTTGKEFLIDEIGTYGEMELDLSDFAFDRNGKFYFFATATKVVPEIIEGMFLTGRQSYEWTDDLVNPEYWLTINIGGYTPIFEMSDFMDWYGVESKFDEPTAMFSAIAGFFEPIFNKIGEFGNRIENYFNVNESYTQGYEIGKAIPYFTYFVGQVAFFLGGFPIMKWLFVIILLLTGIFIFRLILKFIPGLG